MFTHLVKPPGGDSLWRLACYTFSGFLTAVFRIIDEKLTAAHQALIAVAAVLPVQDLGHPAELQHWLDDRRGLLSTFDNGLFVFSVNGDLIVESPFKPERRGRNFSFRDYFQQTIQSGKPFISDPYLSSQQHNHPAIMMTAPVFDQQGQLIAIFSGALDLMRDNFLGQLSRQKIGRDGYFFLAGLDRMMIVHPEAGRIMKKDVPLGSNPLFDRAMEGIHSCDVNVNSRGLIALTAFRQLTSKNWALGANYPLCELQHPLDTARRLIWGALGATFLVLFLLTLTSLRLIFRPLFRFTDHLSRLKDKNGSDRLFRYASAGEFAIMTNSFNQMIQELDLSHKHLDDAQKMAHLGNWHWERESNQLLWSDEVFRIMGDTPGAYQPTFDRFTKKIHPNDRAVVLQAIDASLESHAPYRVEHRIQRPDGSIRHVREQGEVKLESCTPGKAGGLFCEPLKAVVQTLRRLKA
ncbi:MAG: PAS domain-containing protein, partial [Desulfuromonadaceae bacterium]|nr:PAS domain-containing protein [Desulfuromonadaceae bacterium]